MPILAPGETGHFVYRAVDADGEVLYIGRSDNLAQRLSAHRSSVWWAKAAHIWWIRYPEAIDAVEFERACIEAERPPFNKQFMPKPDAVDLPPVQRPSSEFAVAEEYATRGQVPDAPSETSDPITNDALLGMIWRFVGVVRPGDPDISREYLRLTQRESA